MRIAAIIALTLPILAMAAACETPIGNNLKPMGMKQAGADYVMVIPLCPGEQILYVDVEGDGYEWYVSDPVHPQATEVVLGDNSAFGTINTDTIPVGSVLDAPGSGEMHVSVSTSKDTNQRYRFEGDFHVNFVDSAVNGGGAFDNKNVSITKLQKSSNC